MTTNTQPKHTPAPWRYHKSEHDCEYIITGSNENGGSILPILGRTHNFPNNNEANARLIAAAPELLEALERLMRPGEQAIGMTADELQADYDYARKAIVKAPTINNFNYYEKPSTNHPSNLLCIGISGIHDQNMQQ